MNTIVSSGRSRQFLLHSPAGVAAETELPLVLVFPGFTQTPRQLQHIAGWDELADRELFRVVYLRRTKFPLRWASHEHPDRPTESARDVTFVRDLLEHLDERFSIDVARIFTAGFSNGAGMALLAGLALEGRIAAVGGVSGTYTVPDDVSTRPLPLMLIHGLADQLVPFAGNPKPRRGFALPPVGEWAAHFAHRNGCAEPELSKSGDVRVTFFPGGQQRDVSLVTVESGGHAWPGGKPQYRWVTGHTPSAPNATELLWQFFCEHPAAMD